VGGQFENRSHFRDEEICRGREQEESCRTFSVSRSIQLQGMSGYFSELLQLVSEEQGRKRLIQRARTSSALLRQGCEPRWRNSSGKLSFNRATTPSP
jgi:hypothetical protein